MFAYESVTEVGDHPCNARRACRLYRQVALGVQSHRAVGKVG
jgi:hypothetical protein